MSKRGKTLYLKAVVSDLNVNIETPEAYAPSLCKQRIDILDGLTGTATPACYIDGLYIPSVLKGPETVAVAFAAQIEAVTTADTGFAARWRPELAEVGSTILTFVRRGTDYGVYPLLKILGVNGEDRTAQYTTEIAYENRGAKTAAEDLYNSFTTDFTSICFDTEQAYVNSYARSFGLAKEPTLDPNPVTGDEDNDGQLPNAYKATLNIVGIDGTDGNTVYNAIAGLNGQRKYFYFIDCVSGHVEKCGLLLCRLSSPTKGNAKKIWTITGEETGDEADLYKFLIMINEIPA